MPSYAQSFLSYMFKNKFQVSTDDYKILPKNILQPHNDPYILNESETKKHFSTINYLHKGTRQQANFESFMEKTGTTAILLIKDDKIIYENYFNGATRGTPHKLFSITKSFTSALIGIAIEKGYIQSVNDLIEYYIPELSVKNITIKHLLQMDAGIKFTEGHLPWKDEAKVFLHPDARQLALSVSHDGASKFFHYNDYHLLLLGLILERATGRTNTEFLQEHLWNPLRMEYPGYLIVDNEKHRFEKLESGLVMTAIDLAKFGQLFLHKGQSIINESWVSQSTNGLDVPLNREYFHYYDSHPWGKMWFRQDKAYYKYLWWGHKNRANNNDYFALGALGQVLYISPENNAIAIRLGKKWGVMDWWPSILHKMLNQE